MTTTQTKGLTVPRIFSSPDVNPYDQIEWVKTEAKITDDAGKTIFVQTNVEVPGSWSALATKIAVSKYFYGDAAKGTDPGTGGRETAVRLMINRVVDTINRRGNTDAFSHK